jgi:hypothetical protein
VNSLSKETDTIGDTFGRVVHLLNQKNAESDQCLSEIDKDRINSKYMSISINSECIQTSTSMAGVTAQLNDVKD